jgi:hypothetical protein
MLLIAFPLLLEIPTISPYMTFPTRYWKSELDQMATTVLKPRVSIAIVVFAVEDNFWLPTD